jgi:rubrerythrin
MTQNIQVCRKCGIVFNIERRKDKDCPLCHSGEHMSFTYDSDNNI